MGMTYRLTAYGKSRRSLPGVPWRELSAEEYAAALAANPGMEERGYFELAPNPFLADLVPDVVKAQEGFAELNKTLKGRVTSDAPADLKTDEGQG